MLGLLRLYICTWCGRQGLYFGKLGVTFESDFTNVSNWSGAGPQKQIHNRDAFLSER